MSEHYCSDKALRDMIESDAIPEDRKADLQIEYLRRKMQRTFGITDQEAKDLVDSLQRIYQVGGK